MKWLAKLRQQAGIETQDDLVARLELSGFNYTRAAVSHWENGTRGLPLDDPDFRRALARILRVSVHELLKQAGYEVEKPDHSSAAEQAATMIDQLPPDKQKLALRLLAGLFEP